MQVNPDPAESCTGTHCFATVYFANGVPCVQTKHCSNAVPVYQPTRCQCNSNVLPHSNSNVLPTLRWNCVGRYNGMALEAIPLQLQVTCQCNFSVPAQCSFVYCQCNPNVTANAFPTQCTCQRNAYATPMCVRQCINATPMYLSMLH